MSCIPSRGFRVDGALDVRCLISAANRVSVGPFGKMPTGRGAHDVLFLTSPFSPQVPLRCNVLKGSLGDP